MALDGGHGATVHYFVKTLEMDITKFHEVIASQLLTHNCTFEHLVFTRRCGLLCQRVSGATICSSIHYIAVASKHLIDFDLKITTTHAITTKDCLYLISVTCAHARLQNSTIITLHFHPNKDSKITWQKYRITHQSIGWSTFLSLWISCHRSIRNLSIMVASNNIEYQY